MGLAARDASGGRCREMPPAAGGLRPPAPPNGAGQGGEGRKGRLGWAKAMHAGISAKTPKYLRAVGPLLREKAKRDGWQAEFLKIES